MSPGANKNMDPAMHRVTNPTKKSTTRNQDDGLQSRTEAICSRQQVRRIEIRKSFSIGKKGEDILQLVLD